MERGGAQAGCTDVWKNVRTREYASDGLNETLHPESSCRVSVPMNQQKFSIKIENIAIRGAQRGSTRISYMARGL